IYVPESQPTRRPWSNVPPCRYHRLSTVRHLLLRSRVRPRAKEVLPFLAAAFFPFFLRALSQPRIPAFSPRVPSFSPQVSPSPFPPVAPLNHRLSRLLRRFSLPGLRRLWFRARRPFPRQFL